MFLYIILFIIFAKQILLSICENNELYKLYDIIVLEEFNILNNTKKIEKVFSKCYIKIKCLQSFFIIFVSLIVFISVI